MAKKKIQIDSNLVLNGKFNIKIPKDLKTAFEKELKRGELSLSIEIHYNDLIGMQNIYSDDITNGGLIFEKIDNDFYKVEVTGVVNKKLESEFDKELIEFLKLNKSHVIVASYIGDNDSNWYYIDGDENKTTAVGTIDISK
jgi:hypothetical protein